MMLKNSRNSGMGCIVVVILACSALALGYECVDNEPRRREGGIKPDSCMDGNIRRELNTTWLAENCTKCTCTSEGLISCCTRVLKPLLVDKACEALLNMTSCKYEVKRKDDSSEPCSSWARM